MNNHIEENVYECGKNTCKSKTTLKEKEPLVCNKCGYRILYKIRSKHNIQYSAR